jgi:hypothetical protein
LLEFRAHEPIARSAVDENGKVDIEPEEVDKGWNDDETDASRKEMASNMFLRRSESDKVATRRLQFVTHDR